MSNSDCLETAAFYTQPSEAIALKFGDIPMQCSHCGRRLINMICNACFPVVQFIPPPAKNRGGFPIFGQLSLAAPSSSVSVPEKPRARLKKLLASELPTPVRHVHFVGVDNNKLKLSDGLMTVPPPVGGGTDQPFKSHVRKDQKTFTVLAKFKWGSHEWETKDVPCESDIKGGELFRCLCIHFSKLLKATEKCQNSEVCLCGLDSSIAEEKVIINGYQLFIDSPFTILVEVGTIDV